MSDNLSKEKFDNIKKLTPYISEQFLINWEYSEDAWCLKNENLKPVYMNALYSRLLEKREDSVSCVLTPFKNIIAIHDHRVMMERRRVLATGILPASTVAALSVFECERMPFYDSHAKPSGIISHFKSIRMVTPRFFINGEWEDVLTTTCPPGPFSSKEWEIVCLMIAGMSEKEMAKKLCRSLRTIKFHKSNILALTQCQSTRDFISLSRKNKWEFYIPPLFSRPRYIISQ
ncbi:helix-turn-helix transcriptional regulator [Klebsiella aerogenes]|nr:helix-turn-helix transcriptional regulator [Klebsiella aerogenes]HEO1675008.1 helix-turn-helix transcriptional regulator [Klebsiella aerogenes]